MNKLILSFIALNLSIISISCSQDSQSPSREYEEDAEILARFVDINKSEGTYFINENLKLSALSYITEKNWKELQAVSLTNRARFENELKELNSELANCAQREDISQIIYSTYTETWIRDINKTPVKFTINKSAQPTIASRATAGNLTLWSGMGVLTSNFNGPRLIESEIHVEMYGRKYYYFEISCKIDAKQSGLGNNPKSVIISGTGVSDYYHCTWLATENSSNIDWIFSGKIHAPYNAPTAMVRIDFVY